jgi:peroxiredoxin
MKAYSILLCVALILGVSPLAGQDGTTSEEVDQNQHIPEGLMEGEMAPDFTVRDIYGQNISLKQSLRKGPLVLVFYKGSWEGEDMQYLFNLNDSLASFDEAEAQVVALSMEQVAYTKKINSKKQINYALAEDIDGKVAKIYDVLFNVDEEFCRQLMQKGNINLQERYDAEIVTMSAPAIFVISKQGKIMFSHFDFDSGSRPFVSELVDILASHGPQRSEQPMLEETGGEPVKNSRKKKERN